MLWLGMIVLYRDLAAHLDDVLDAYMIKHGLRDNYDNIVLGLV